MKRFVAFLGLALGIALCLGAYARAENVNNLPDISAQELNLAIQAHSVVILDCNGTDSYNSGHIPGALNFDAVQDHLSSVLPANKSALIVAYCGGPACTRYKKGAAAAIGLRYKNVKHFSGGLKGWTEAHLPLQQ